MKVANDLVARVGNPTGNSSDVSSQDQLAQRMQFVQQQMMQMMQEMQTLMQDMLNREHQTPQGAPRQLPQASNSVPDGPDASNAFIRTPRESENVVATSGPDLTQGAVRDLSPQEIAKTYGKEIKAASEETGIPEGVLAGHIWQESKGRPNTPGGGLMQIQGDEFKSMGGSDINSAADNIMAGAKYMQQMREKYPDISLALRAYNSGPNGVDPNDSNATPAGTGDPTYVQKVLKAAEQSGLSMT